RDLSDEVGGLMMLRALEALGADAATEVVCVIGKPPGRATALRLAEAVGALGKPCVVNFTGEGLARAPWHAAATLEDAARAAVALARGDKPAGVEFTRPAQEIERLVAETVRGLAPGRRAVRGVYAGGTLAWEARGLLAARLGDVAPGVTGGAGVHRVVDLGEDAFTVGRPHPMIDGRVRREWIDKEGRDPGTAVLLLDVVLGYCAHPDPAGEPLPALYAARGSARGWRGSRRGARRSSAPTRRRSSASRTARRSSWTAGPRARRSSCPTAPCCTPGRRSPGSA